LSTHRAVAAIDFGTHGTGFAWAVVDQRNRDARVRDIYVHNQWDGQPVAYPKNLTALLLDGDSDVQAWGFDARRRWATRRAGAANDRTRYEHGFKMALLEGGPDSQRAQRLITLYLTRIYQLALGVMDRSGYKAEDIRWCLTVPAIWGDYQKQVMREAAMDAGLPREDGRLLLAIEPEAAAYYARVAGMRTPAGSGEAASDLLTPGSRFMVVDCGGGTVDITAYTTDSKGWLVEIGRVYGDKLGSEYINQEFVREVVGGRFGSFDTIQRINEEVPSALLSLVDSWENAKLHVTLDVANDIYLPIPASIYTRLNGTVRARLERLQNGVSDHIVVTPEEAIGAFEHVVPGAIELVDRQLAEMRRSGPRTGRKELIVLVGGFGASPYLQQRLGEHVRGRANVLVPPSPSVAVLFGAVHFAYEPQTLARKTKFTYGCKTAFLFRPGVDAESRRFEDDAGRPLCERFQVFVTAGATVEVDHEVVRELLPIFSKQRVLELALCATHERDPQYVDEPGSQQIGLLSVDLEEVMHLPLADREILVAMRFGETEIRVRGTVKHSGKVVEATLRFDPLF
jgi:hypothetical protein